MYTGTTHHSLQLLFIGGRLKQHVISCGVTCVGLKCLLCSQASDEYEKKLEAIHRIELHIQQARAQMLLKEEQQQLTAAQPDGEDDGIFLNGT